MYIFDLDGTITDSNGLWVEVDREFLARRGLTMTREYEDVVGRSIFPVAARFTREYYRLSDSPEAIMAEWEALAVHHYRDLVPLKPGARALLDQCRREGREMALFTACRPTLCRLALDRFQLAGYFRHVVYAEELGVEKHDPRCFARLSQITKAYMPRSFCSSSAPYSSYPCSSTSESVEVLNTCPLASKSLRNSWKL